MVAFLAFIQAIPAIFGGINNFVDKYYDAKVKLVTARVGGNVEVAKAIVGGVVAEGETRVRFLEAVAKSRFLQVLIMAWSGPWIIYEWKVVVWDNIVHHWIWGVYGFTPEIKGLVGTHAAIILTGIFGTGSVMAVGAMFQKWQDRDR